MGRETQNDRPTYPMRVVARMAGVSPERVRAWESRHGAITPMRSDGGTRRYTDEDVERIRLLRRVTEAGHRIGEVATLPTPALRARLPESSPESEAHERIEAMLVAVEELDAGELRSLLAAERGRLGPVVFARDVALPLSYRIGERWTQGRSSIAAEHHATNVIRGMLIETFEEGDPDPLAPKIVFAAPSGERHDLGVLYAGIAARAFGGDPVFVGADVPHHDLIKACEAVRADALALGFVVSSPDQVESVAKAVRKMLPASVELWIGGPAIDGCASIRGVDRIETDTRLEAFVHAARRSGESAVREASS